MSLMGSIGRRIFLGGLELGSGIKKSLYRLKSCLVCDIKNIFLAFKSQVGHNHRTKIKLVWRELVFQNTSSLLLHIL